MRQNLKKDKTKIKSGFYKKFDNILADILIFFNTFACDDDY